jgi:hypothetical protein
MDFHEDRVSTSVLIVKDGRIVTEELCVRSIQIQSEFNWSQEQRKDPDLARIIAWKERDVKPCWEEVSGGSPVLKRLWKEWDVLVYPG